jgi:hypothetical protein
MKSLHLVRGALASAAIMIVPGCSSPPTSWHADLVPVKTRRVEVPSMVRRSACPPVDSAIAAEAQRLTPIAGVMEPDALTAALMGSEAAKNASLARLARAYEKCRRSYHF